MLLSSGADERDAVGRGVASSEAKFDIRSRGQCPSIEAKLRLRDVETLERGGTSLEGVETLKRSGDGVHK
jgi:hypothetical protein